jgi:hypothetical protein
MQSDLKSQRTLVYLLLVKSPRDTTTSSNMLLLYLLVILLLVVGSLVERGLLRMYKVSVERIFFLTTCTLGCAAGSALFARKCPRLLLLFGPQCAWKECASTVALPSIL